MILEVFCAVGFFVSCFIGVLVMRSCAGGSAEIALALESLWLLTYH